MSQLIAQCNSFFGCITPISPIGDVADPKYGIIAFGNNILKVMIIIAGLYAFINIIVAGYDFLSAGGDSKKLEGAWGKIWQSLIGLALIAGSFVLAAIFGWLIFKDPTAILSPKLYGAP